MVDAGERKRELLAAEMQRYFGETCPALAARCEAVIIGLPPPILRELAGRLQEFEAVTDKTNRQLKAAQAAAFEDEESAELVLDRALASLEHLNEVAEAITKHLDGLPKM
jgi:hypothetical protein